MNEKKIAQTFIIKNKPIFSFILVTRREASNISRARAMGYFHLFFICHLTMIRADFSEHYSIRPIPPTELLFEHKGRARFYSQTWTIITGFKIDNFTEELVAVQKYEKLIRNVCDTWIISELRKHCIQSIRTLDALTTKIKTTSAKLRELTTNDRPNSARNKRSIFNSFRTIAKLWTGTMDHIDSEDIYDNLKMLRSDDSQTLKLMKNQVSVVRSTYNAINRTLLQLANIQMETDTRLFDINRHLKKLKHKVSREHTEIMGRLMLGELISYITLELMDITQQQDTTMSIITTLNAGRLHPLVLDATQLNEIYGNISAQRGMDNLFENQQIYLEQLTKVVAVQNGKFFLVQLEIPLVKTTEFEVYRMYSIPVPSINPNEYQVLHSVGDYLVVQQLNHLYVQLSRVQFNQCTHIDEGFDETAYFLCKLDVPIWTSARENCAISLFEQKVNVTACDWKMHALRDSIYKMEMSSTWLWLYGNESKVSVFCENSFVEDPTVPKHSIIQLNGPCEIHTDTMILTGENNILRNVSVLHSKTMFSKTLQNIEEFAQMNFVTTPQPAAVRPGLEDEMPAKLQKQRERNYNRWLNANNNAVRRLEQNVIAMDKRRRNREENAMQPRDAMSALIIILVRIGQLVVNVFDFIFEISETLLELFQGAATAA